MSFTRDKNKTPVDNVSGAMIEAGSQTGFKLKQNLTFKCD